MNGRRDKEARIPRAHNCPVTEKSTLSIPLFAGCLFLAPGVVAGSMSTTRNRAQGSAKSPYRPCPPQARGQRECSLSLSRRIQQDNIIVNICNRASPGLKQLFFWKGVEVGVQRMGGGEGAFPLCLERADGSKSALESGCSHIDKVRLAHAARLEKREPPKERGSDVMRLPAANS